MSLCKQYRHMWQWRYSFNFSSDRRSHPISTCPTDKQFNDANPPLQCAPRRTAPRDRAATKYLPQRSLMRPNYHNWNCSTCSKIPSSPPSLGIIFTACKTVALFEVAQIPQRTAIVSLNTVSQLAFLVETPCACWRPRTENETSLQMNQTHSKDWQPVLL